MTAPYASIHIECKKIPGKITGFITHKIDFINLWNAFKERGVKENEEVLIIWSIKHYKNKIFKVFSRVMPKLWVMIWRKGAFEMFVNLNQKTESLTDEGIRKTLGTGPLAEWKPDVME